MRVWAAVWCAVVVAGCHEGGAASVRGDDDASSVDAAGAGPLDPAPDAGADGAEEAGPSRPLAADPADGGEKTPRDGSTGGSVPADASLSSPSDGAIADASVDSSCTDAQHPYDGGPPQVVRDGGGGQDAAIDAGQDATDAGQDATLRDAESDALSSDSGMDGPPPPDGGDADTQATPACLIQGATWPAGAINPVNACQSCDPLNSPSTWSDRDAVRCEGVGYCSSGRCLTAPSCLRGNLGVQNCGPDGGESCCASPAVQGGPVDLTFEAPDGGYYHPSAFVSGFRLDKYLVTVGRFRKFVEAVIPDGRAVTWLPSDGAGRHTHLDGGGLSNAGLSAGTEPGWDSTSSNSHVVLTTAALTSCDSPDAGSVYSTWSASVGDEERRPINCVTWEEAYAFCIWDNAFLPSEAEWQYAVAGGRSPGSYTYPWGGSGDGADYAVYGCNYGTTNSAPCTGVINIAPVGSAALGVGRWGQMDLVGELREWTIDIWNDYPTKSDCVDCAYTSGPGDHNGLHVYRGGDFVEVYSVPASARRASPPGGPDDRDAFNGFRCARGP